MKTMLFTVSLLFLFSCEKKIEISQEIINKAEAFTKFVKTGKFQLVAFYSDLPIDYDPNDAYTIKETDHWKYVQNHVKDDHLSFKESQVEITQNTNKINTIADEVIVRPFSIKPIKNGVSFTFVDYRYNSLQYYLHEMTNDSYTVYVNVGEAKLFSTFKIIQ